MSKVNLFREEMGTQEKIISRETFYYVFFSLHHSNHKPLEKST